MKKLSTILLMAVCFSVIAVAIGSLIGGPQAAGPPNTAVNIAQVSVSSVPVSGTVNVGNTVPVSGAVSVGNFPSVQAVAGTVNVANFPQDQQVSLIGNAPTTPLFTLDVENPAHNPWALPFACTVPSGVSICSSNGFIVPTGSELVIETISAFAALPSGERPQVFFGFVTAGGSTQITIPLTFMATTSGIIPDNYGVTQPVRIYADGGTSVSFAASESGTSAGATNFQFQASGHFVRCGTGTGVCPP
jgi:hypothetical protein